MNTMSNGVRAAGPVVGSPRTRVQVRVQTREWAHASTCASTACGLYSACGECAVSVRWLYAEGAQTVRAPLIHMRRAGDLECAANRRVVRLAARFQNEIDIRKHSEGQEFLGRGPRHHPRLLPLRRCLNPAGWLGGYEPFPPIHSDHLDLRLGSATLPFTLIARRSCPGRMGMPRCPGVHHDSLPHHRGRKKKERCDCAGPARSGILNIGPAKSWSASIVGQVRIRTVNSRCIRPVNQPSKLPIGPTLPHSPQSVNPTRPTTARNAADVGLSRWCTEVDPAILPGSIPFKVVSAIFFLSP